MARNSAVEIQWKWFRDGCGTIKKFSGGRVWRNHAIPIDQSSRAQYAMNFGGSGTKYDRAKAFYESFGFKGTLYDMEMGFLAYQGKHGTLLDRWQATLDVGNGTRGIGDYIRATRGPR